MSSGRLDDLQRFYAAIHSLEKKLGGARTLAGSTGRMKWPRRGVYFFMENGELRSDSGTGPRIVRVGTHALNAGSGTKLWTRLSQHRARPVAVEVTTADRSLGLSSAQRLSPGACTKVPHGEKGIRRREMFAPPRFHLSAR